MRTYLLLFICSVFFISCEDNYSYPLELTTKQVFNLEANSNDWVENVDSLGKNRYYSCHFELSSLNALSDYKIRTGAAMAYIDYESYQQVLPFTRYYEKPNDTTWTRTIDFDYSDKAINFYVSSSDFAINPPGTMYFKVIYIW